LYPKLEDSSCFSSINSIFKPEANSIYNKIIQVAKLSSSSYTTLLFATGLKAVNDPRMLKISSQNQEQNVETSRSFS
jgi:hypothetical protein